MQIKAAPGWWETPAVAAGRRQGDPLAVALPLFSVVCKGTRAPFAQRDKGVSRWCRPVWSLIPRLGPFAPIV